MRIYSKADQFSAKRRYRQYTGLESASTGLMTLFFHLCSASKGSSNLVQRGKHKIHNHSTLLTLRFCSQKLRCVAAIVISLSYFLVCRSCLQGTLKSRVAEVKRGKFSLYGLYQHCSTTSSPTNLLFLCFNLNFLFRSIF